MPQSEIADSRVEVRARLIIYKDEMPAVWSRFQGLDGGRRVSRTLLAILAEAEKVLGRDLKEAESSASLAKPEVPSQPPSHPATTEVLPATSDTQPAATATSASLSSFASEFGAESIRDFMSVSTSTKKNS